MTAIPKPITRPTTPPMANPRRGTSNAGSASSTMIPPSERYPPAASPQVCRRRDPLRFTAAQGPIFSKINTDDEVCDDAPGGAEGSRDNPSDGTEPFGDRPQDQSDRGGHQRPTGDPANVLSRDLQAIRNRGVATVQSDHRRAHHGGIEVDRHEERHEVDDGQSQ